MLKYPVFLINKSLVTCKIVLFCLFHHLDVTKSGEDLQTAQPDSEGQLPQEGTGEGTETAQGAETGQDQTEGQLETEIP